MTTPIILTCQHTGAFGGVQHTLLDIAKNIDREKFEPIVICSPGGELPRLLAEQNVRVQAVGKGEYLRYSSGQPFGTIRDLFAVTREIIRLAKKEGVQVIHTFDGMLFFAASLAKLLQPNLKVIWLDSGFNLYPLHFRLVMKWCFKRAAMVAAVTGIRRAQLLEEGLEETKSAVFHCGTDFHLRPQVADPLAETNFKGTFRVGIVGRLVPIKNFELFLQSARIVADKHAHVRFHIVGQPGFLESDMEYFRQIEAQMRRLNLTELITFHQPVEDLSSILGGFDVLVSSSHIETFGRTLVEAMAMSKPIVATAVGGVPEVIADGEVGFLVRAGDAEAFAESICRLVEDTDLREAMGRKGLQRVLERFDVRAITKRWEQTYESLLLNQADLRQLIIELN
ncbi:MAG: glycosyltransferase family 4 protein [Acidobacteria bacterium]|nr:glycosyltransferase family 4 protein [Acidobacteriota bacterium]